MQSLKARITRLENRTLVDSLSAIVISFLTPSDEKNKPVLTLYEPVSSARWEREADEAEQAFIDRAAREANAHSRIIPLLFVDE